ncbi:MAG: response regulator [Vicinamibacterales bacterium]
MPALKVLIVDDYADSLEAWSYFLRARGFEVITADNGIDAVEVALAELPDVVILDLDLPGRHGIEVARLLQNDPSTTAIPLIAMTGRSHALDVDRARASGFQSVLLKPYAPEALVDELRRVCETRIQDAPLP